MVSKYPPIEGGVSTLTYWTARLLAEQGNEIHVVSNAVEVEPEFRMWLEENDQSLCEMKFEVTGGFTKVYQTPIFEKRLYIPWTNPFVTKLAGIITEVVRREHCQLIYAHYLEPYGIAAYLGSTWSGVPYVIRHAGSDIGRLMSVTELNVAYQEVLKRAAVVITPSIRRAQFFQEMGIPEKKIVIDGDYSVPTDYFNPGVSPIDINDLLERAKDWILLLPLLQETKETITKINQKKFNPAIPTIGIYGKVGEIKGSFDLVRALGKIKKKCQFNFLAMTSGYPRQFHSFINLLQENDLFDQTWILPFLPHWKVPLFIKACSLVCFLERNFPIKFHSPIIPREILACGVCLLCSREIVNKQLYQKDIVDGQNMIIINDPQNAEGLAAQILEVIKDKERMVVMGKNGYNLSLKTEDFKKFRESRKTLFEKLIAISSL